MAPPCCSITTPAATTAPPRDSARALFTYLHQQVMETAPLTGERRGVDAAYFPWGCPMGCATADLVLGAGTVMLALPGAHPHGRHRRPQASDEVIDTVYMVPRGWIQKAKRSPTSLWERMNGVNHACNKGDTMSAASDAFKVLVGPPDMPDLRVWLVLDPAKTARM